MWFELGTILLLFALFTIWFYRKASLNKDYYKNFDGPPPLPFFGNVLEVRTTKEILDALLKFTKQYGDVYKLQLGPFRKALIVSDYKLLEQILGGTKILTKSDDYEFFYPWLGNGLLTSDGMKWKKHRKMLTPAFHFKILERFINVFETAGNKLVEKFQNEVGKPSFDVYPYVTLCTLDIICDSAMGTSVNAQDDANSSYVRSVKAMCTVIIERIFHLLEMNKYTYPLTSNYYIEKKSLGILHNYTNAVINNRRLQLKKISTNTFCDSKEKKPFLDLLLEATVDDKKLTHEEIADEVNTFMFEGHDTTSSAISFALYCLANHSDVQMKAFEEQQTLFGEIKNPEMTYADLQSMKYLELVIKETLRLYPSVPFFGRKTIQNVECADGSVIPKDVTFNIFAFGVHRNPKYFPDPEKFDPSRFDNYDGSLPYAYIPFSAGPRNCIGQKFAMLEMKSTISKVLRHFELVPSTPEKELVLVAESILKSANGIHIALHHRD